MRWKLITWLTIKATELSNLVLKQIVWPYQFEAYQHMSQNSLGYKYQAYLKRHKIEYKPNLIKHDMKHIILGYDMKMPGELEIVAFLIGNKSYNKIGVIYLLICLLIVPEYSLKLVKHYKRGKAAKCLKHYRIDSFVEADLNKTREFLNIK